MSLASYFSVFLICFTSIAFIFLLHPDPLFAQTTTPAPPGMKCANYTIFTSPCPLDWEIYVPGNDLPEFSLPIDSITNINNETVPQIFVLREIIVNEFNETTITIGYYNILLQRAFFPVIRQARDFSTGDFDEEEEEDLIKSELTPYYEILINPKECFIAWMDIDVGRFEEDSNIFSKILDRYPKVYYFYDTENDFLSDDEYDLIDSDTDDAIKFIGLLKQEGQYELWKIGEIRASPSPGAIFVHNGSEIISSSKFQILNTAYTDFRIEIKNFRLARTAVNIVEETIGVDEIENINVDNVIISQTIEHRKFITENYIIRKPHQQWFVDCFQSISNTSYDIPDIPIVPTITVDLNLTVEVYFTYHSNYIGETLLDTTQDREVIITREVIVPPFTSVRTCSRVMFEYSPALQEYEAEVVYKATGVGVDDILEFVTDNGIDNAKINEHGEVSMKISGTYTGKFQMESQFDVVSTDGVGGATGCKFKSSVSCEIVCTKKDEL